MCDQKPMSSLHEIGDEGSSMTGGKSVSEIIQLLRTNTKLKTAKRVGVDDMLEDDIPRKSNQAFPWMIPFNKSCREILSDLNIKKLDDIVSTFLKNVEGDVKQCYSKPKRAYKLRLRMNSFLLFFHMVYWEIKKPLEHTSYLDKMSDILALYIDVELKSSRRGREHPKKIAERICSSLYLLLDKSIDHMLDSVLKAKYFIKKYSDICVPVMARLLKEHPGKMYDTNYVRYLLSFKLWKKLAGKEHYSRITEEAVSKLIPPPNFAERVKSGMFSNVLPYVFEKDRITLFFMQSPFNVKEKAEQFLKECRKVPSQDLEKAFLFDDDFRMTPVFDNLPQKEGDNTDSIKEVWNSLMEKETDPLEELFSFQALDGDDDEKIEVYLKKPRFKFKKDTKNKANNGVVKSSLKKRKTSKESSCLSLKRLLSKESAEVSKTNKSKHMVIPATAQEENSFVTCITIEDSSFKVEDKTSLSLSNSPESLKKPCATVEPEQCKEVEPDSQSKGVLLINQSTTCTDIVNNEVLKSGDSNVQEASMSLNNECAASLVSETCLESGPSDLADSSGICEEFKAETNSNDLFVVEELYKDRQIMHMDQLVAEEVVIGTDINNDMGCTTFLIMEADGGQKLDQTDVMNVIDISNEPCSESEHINVESNYRKPHNKERGSLDNPINNQSHPKVNFNKVQSPISTGNQQFLPSIASYENNSDSSFDRRPDTYSYNDTMLARLFSEVNADEGSDDENRYHNQGQFARGGKITAFQEQMEESKSDAGEDFESPSPESRSDSQRSTVAASPEMNILHAIPMDKEECQDSEQAEKTNTSIPVQSEPLTQPDINTEKPLPFDSHKLREVSVNLSYMSELGNLSDYRLVNKEKSNPKGKRGSSRQLPNKKKSGETMEEPEDSSNDEDNIPLFCLEERRSLNESKSTKPQDNKRSVTRSISSTRIKSKGSHQTPPTVVKPPPQAVKKNRRSKRKR